jgi:hypothetical protein
MIPLGCVRRGCRARGTVVMLMAGLLGCMAVMETSHSLAKYIMLKMGTFLISGKLIVGWVYCITLSRKH